MDEDAIRSYFSENSKMVNAHSYINFVTGFHLTNKGFARLITPKHLCIRMFEVLLGSIHKGYDIPTHLLKRELEDRQVLLHSFGTVHLMENYATKVGRISEQERAKQKLCPKSGFGITKRLLVNVKHNAIKWMSSKMKVRQHILPNVLHPPAREMLCFSLWRPEIFPEEAFEYMKTRHPGKNLEPLLGIKAKLPGNLQNAY